MCLPALAAVPAMLASAASTVGSTLMAIPGMSTAASAASSAGGALTSMSAGQTAGLNFLSQAGSSVAGFMSQRAQANAQNAAFEANRDAALVARSDDLEAINLESAAQADDGASRLQEARLGGQAAQATARTMAGERGITGLTMNALMQDAGMATGRSTSAIQRNRAYQREGVRTRYRGAANSAESRINSVRRARGPSGLAFATDLGSSAIQSLNMYRNLSG